MSGIDFEARRTTRFAVRAFNKFNNDWTMNLVAMVAYNALTSFIPLILALLTVLALLQSVAGNPQHIANQLNIILPSNVRSQVDVADLIHQINKRSGLLFVISTVGLLWAGTNLFGSIESAFAIIFRVKTRDLAPQKLMEIIMILIFVVLIPISFASTLILSAATTTLGKILPGYLIGPYGLAIGYGTTLAALFVLFMAIYIIVPNIPISWRCAWRGGVVAAVAMTLVNNLFPYYTAHFLNTKEYGTAALATSIVVIIWFWFFALILLVGAQVNSLAMGIGYWKHDLTRTLMDQKVPTLGGVPSAADALQRPRAPEGSVTPASRQRDDCKLKQTDTGA